MLTQMALAFGKDSRYTLVLINLVADEQDTD